MDLTFVIPAKNDPDGLTAPCIANALRSARERRIEPQFILIADRSDEQSAVVDIFRCFRAAHPELAVRIARCRRWLHYSGVFSLGLAAAAPGDVFFLSNDMIMPPAFLRASIGVAALSDDIGIVRGTSAYVDSHPEHEVTPPESVRTRLEFEAFAERIYRENGTRYTVDDVLSGDAVLVRRRVIDAIGVLDTRFFGYFGDVDYGLRAQLAGFRLVCAKGAWLYHLGAGHLKREAAGAGHSLVAVRDARMALAGQASKAFAEKWRLDLSALGAGGDTVVVTMAQQLALARRAPDVQLEFRLPEAFWADVEFV